MIFRQDKEGEKLRPVALASSGYYRRHAGHFCDFGLKVVNDKPPSKASKAGSLGLFKRKRLGFDQVFYVADACGTCKFPGHYVAIVGDKVVHFMLPFQAIAL